MKRGVLIHERKLLRASGTALAFVAALSVAACTESNNDNANSTSTGPVTTASEATTTTLSPSEVNKQYITSEARNSSIQKNVEAAGINIVAALQTGKLGPYDFYNLQSNEWASQNPATSGWGDLQHNPQYGGSAAQVAVMVFRNSDGTFDLSQGIQQLQLSVGDNPRISFESPKSANLIDPTYPDWDNWEVTITRDGQTLSINASTLEWQLADLQNFDSQALDILQTSFNELGLQ